MGNGGVCGSHKFSEIYLDNPGHDIHLHPHKTTFVVLKLRPADSDKLRQQLSMARVTVDVTVKVVSGGVSGVYMAVRKGAPGDNSLYPVGVQHEASTPGLSLGASLRSPVRSQDQIRRERMSPHANMMNRSLDSTMGGNMAAIQEDYGPGGCKLRMLPSHTNNFAPADYFISIMCGPEPSRIIISAVMNNRDVLGMHTSPFGFNGTASLGQQGNFGGTGSVIPFDGGGEFYRAKNQTDEQYIEELRWKITDLERELDDRDAEMQRLGDVKYVRKLEKQIEKLRNRIDELETSEQPGHLNHNHLEAQVEQYKTNAKKAKKIIEQLNEKVEEKRRNLAIHMAELDELKEKASFYDKILKKHHIKISGVEFEEFRHEYEKEHHMHHGDTHTHTHHGEHHHGESRSGSPTSHHHHPSHKGGEEHSHSHKSHKHDHADEDEWSVSGHHHSHTGHTHKDGHSHKDEHHHESHKDEGHHHSHTGHTHKDSHTGHTHKDSHKDEHHSHTGHSHKDEHHSHTGHTHKDTHKDGDHHSHKGDKEHHSHTGHTHKDSGDKDGHHSHTGHTHKDGSHTGHTHKDSHKEDHHSHTGLTHKDSHKDDKDKDKHHSHTGHTHKDSHKDDPFASPSHKDKDGHHSHTGHTHKDKEKDGEHHHGTHKEGSSSLSHKDKESKDHSHKSHTGNTHKSTGKLPSLSESRHDPFDF